MTTIQSASVFLPIIEKMQPKKPKFQMLPETTIFYFILFHFLFLETLLTNGPIFANFENKIFMGEESQILGRDKWKNMAKTGKCSISQNFQGDSPICPGMVGTTSFHHSDSNTPSNLNIEPDNSRKLSF